MAQHEILGADSQAEFEPVMKLNTIDHVTTGEEDEDLLYSHRSRLYRFDPSTNEWKERGTGDVKILQDRNTKRVRMILRQERTYKLVMNQSVHPEVELKPNFGSDRCWTWATTDFAEEEPVVATLAIKFKTAEIANEFKDWYNKCRETNRAHPSAEEKEDQEDEEEVWDKILTDKQFSPLGPKEIRALWDKYDEDGSGTLDPNEIQRLLTDLMLSIFKSIKMELNEQTLANLESFIPIMVDKVFTKLDRNGDGVISWSEFQNVDDVKLFAGPNM